MDLNNIVIRGARQNNLKNVNLTIPRSKFTVVTGVSGSGKSSIAFDTLYAEGQRRFVGSFSGSSQQQFEKPDFDQILGLNPTIAIEQKNNSSNPRSTVGTLTDIYDYLRVLFVRVGTFHCPQCGKAVEPYNSQQVVSRLSSLKKGTEFRIFAPVAKGAKGEQSKLFGDFVKQGYSHARIDMKVYDLRDEIPSLDKAELHSIEVEIDRMAVPENVQGGNSQFLDRLVNAVKKAYKAGKGTLIVSLEGEKDITLSEKNVCPDCDITYSELKTSYFSYNHPEGMCPECDGLGVKLNIDANLIVNKPHLSLMDGACQIYGDMRKAKKGGNWVTGQVFALAEKLGVDMEQPWQELPKEFRDAVLYGTGEECIHFTHEMNKGGRSSDINRPMEGLVNMVNRLYRQTKQDKNREAYAQYMSEQPCQLCKGERLCPEARYVEIGNVRYPEVASMSIARLNGWISNLPNILKSDKLQVARELLKEIQVRLQFMIRVGLHYLSLERPAPTLSGGEAQRIRLATQLGCGLVGILYVLDEPSIGLHPRDHKPLLETMKNLKDSGNTVVVVEHDADTMYEADYMIELGPGAGVLGGQLVATGTPQELMQNPLSLTGRYLKGELKISSPKGAKKRQPKGWLNLIGAQMNNLKDVTARFPIGMLTCVTGVSGSGKSSLVAQTLAPALSRILNNSQDIPGSYKQIEGIALLDKLIRVNQTPIGRTPRSNPATYIEVFDEVRKVFAATDEAKIRGISADWFSFNNKEGCCESCEGLGMKKVELHFLPDAWIKCQDCNGQRYNQQVLEVKYKGKTISDVLDMDAQQALELFEGNAKITRILRTLQDVGLDYIKLGQSAVSLSGGEAQRIKLAKELCRPDTGKTIYILDEPTTGLHFADIQKLLNVLHRLTDQGNTIIIIEHNLDVVKTADWVIDVGPNGGDEGGRIVAQGTPEEVSEVEESYTGKFLKQLYSRN
nr:excinuclease ABC subunit UvrA [Anaerobacterium chartisolvens]